MSGYEYPSSGQCPTNAGRQQTKKSIKNTVGASKVIEAFNTWAFKREQPSDLALLTRTVQASMDKGQPVEFVLYWGKGRRSTIAAPDLQCLDYLAAFAHRVKAAYAPGALVTLVCTDTHAALNGHPGSAAARYFEDIACAGGERGFKCCKLGDLVANFRNVVRAADRTHRPPETMERLTRCASRWYRGDGTARDGATAYFDMNMVEKQVIEAGFSQAIFITFNGSEHRELFPDRLAVFYMYSLRKGFGVKPWFVDVETGTEAEAELRLGSVA